MSVKFEKETIREGPFPGGHKHGIAHKIGEKFLGGGKQGGEKHGIAHELGEKLTGGHSQTGYLAVRRIDCLHEKPS